MGIRFSDVAECYRQLQRVQMGAVKIMKSFSVSSGKMEGLNVQFRRKHVLLLISDQATF